MFSLLEGIFLQILLTFSHLMLLCGVSTSPLMKYLLEHYLQGAAPTEIHDWSLQIESSAWGAFFFTSLYFVKDDILSHIASTAKYLIEKRKPQSVDERLPLFLLTIFIPSLFFLFFKNFSYFDPENIYSWTSFGLQILFCASWWLLARFSKEQKTLLHLDWKDVLALSTLEILTLFFHLSLGSLSLIYLILRNYKPQAFLQLHLFRGFYIVGLLWVQSLQNLNHSTASEDLFYYAKLLVAAAAVTYFLITFKKKEMSYYSKLPAMLALLITLGSLLVLIRT